MGITDTVRKLLTRRTFVQGMLIILLIIPLSRPLGLPILIGEHSRAFYRIVEELPPNAKILFSQVTPVVLMGDLIPQAIPVTYQLVSLAKERNWKLYFVGIGSPDGILQLIDSEIWATIGWPEEYGLKYGEDWCNLGFVAGGDISWSTFGSDIRAVVQYDREGNNIDSLPMMQDVNSVADFDIIFNNGEYNTVIVRQWGEPYGKPLMLLCLTGAVVQDVEPFYRAGQVKEYLAGVRGGADYELLVNRPGKAIASLDAISISHIFLIGLIALGNVLYFAEKKEKGRNSL